MSSRLCWPCSGLSALSDFNQHWRALKFSESKKYIQDPELNFKSCPSLVLCAIWKLNTRRLQTKCKRRCSGSDSRLLSIGTKQAASSICSTKWSSCCRRNWRWTGRCTKRKHLWWGCTEWKPSHTCSSSSGRRCARRKLEPARHHACYNNLSHSHITI